MPRQELELETPPIKYKIQLRINYSTSPLPNMCLNQSVRNPTPPPSINITILKGNKSTNSYKTIECDACLRNCKSKFSISHNFTPLILNFKKREAHIKYRSKEHTKTYDQPKIKVYTCATDSVPPLDIRDELFISELHLYHPYHQLIFVNSFYNYY